MPADTSVYFKLGVIGDYTGIPIYRSYDIPRGKWMSTVDPAGGRRRLLFEGRGLCRGVPYTVDGLVIRGYLTGPMRERCNLIDAVTGRVVQVRSDDAVEVAAWAP